MTSRSGRTRSTTASSPPTMTDSAPPRAPPAPFDNSLLAADRHRQRPAAGTDVAAGDRGIQRIDPLPPGRGVDLAGERRLARGHANDHRAAARPVEHAALAEDHLPNVGGI